MQGKNLHRPVIELIYDKQCPACDYYCHIVRIREDVGELKLIDAREDSAAMEKITRRGLDIDQGMVLIASGQLYYGPDAIHALSLLGSSHGWFNRFNHWVFQSQRRSKCLYPVLRSLRNLLLKLLRKSKINNLNIKGNDRF